MSIRYDFVQYCKRLCAHPSLHGSQTVPLGRASPLLIPRFHGPGAWMVLHMHE